MLKRILILGMLGVLVFLIPFPASVSTTAEGATIESVTLALEIGSPQLLQNDLTISMDVAPFLENDRTWVPLRFVSESLGAQVSWNQEQQQATIQQDGIELTLQIGSQTLWVNGNPGEMDVAPFLRSNRTWVPLRFVAENLGATVGWQQYNQRVVIRSGLFAEATLAFVREGELILKDLSMGAAGAERVLARGGIEGPLAWSWDGTQIAYYRIQPISEMSFALEVEALNLLDGTTQTVVRRETAYGGLKPLSFHPDGRHLLFDEATSDVSGTLWRVPLYPSEMSLIVPEGEVVKGVFSASGALLTMEYSESEGAGVELVVSDEAGEMRHLPFGEAAFDSSGNRLAVVNGAVRIYDLLDFNADPSLFISPMPFDGRSCWSDDGMLLGTANANGVYALHLGSWQSDLVDDSPQAFPVGFLPRWHELLVERPGETINGGNAYHLFDLDTQARTLLLEDATSVAIRPN